MYDEDLIEDSLAFCRELKSFLDNDGQKAPQPAPTGQPGNRTQGQANPAASKPSVPVSPKPEPSSQSQGAVHRSLASPQPQGSGQTPPAKGAVPSQPQRGSQGQPVRRQAQGDSQRQTVQQTVSRQPQKMTQGPTASRQAQPTQRQVQPGQRAAQAQPTQRQVQPGQRAAQAQPAQRQVQPGQKAVQAQPTQRQVQPGQRAAQAQPTQRQAQPGQRAAQAQPTQRQVQPGQRAAQAQPMQRQVQPGQRAAQAQPAQRQAQPGQRAAQAQPTQRQVQPGQRAAQAQPTQRQVQPEQRTAQAQPAQRQAQPVQRAVQAQKASQLEPPQGVQEKPMQPTPQAVQQPAQRHIEPFRKSSLPDTGMTEKEKAANAIAQEAITKLHEAKESAQTVEEADAIKQLPEDGKHTYEITIKFDFASVKRLFHSLKEKLTPEERTLEDINAAMEENRQRKGEEAQEIQDWEEIPEDRRFTLRQMAKGLIQKLPGRASTEDWEHEALPEESVAGEYSREENRKAGRKQKRKHMSAAARLVNNIVILVFCVGIAYFFAAFVTNFVAHQTTVEGESMEPTLSNGDSVIIQKLSYYFRDPQRYDVVVFPVSYGKMEEEEDTYYIKRVIGLPGETVQIIDGRVYINQEPLEDDKYALSDILDPGEASQPLVLADDEYFVMGDNRNMSTDSRSAYVGLVNRSDILGEAWLCTWPLNHFGTLTR